MKKGESTGLEIAVIGIAGRFPGAANVHQFWENLKNGVESVHFFTEEELKENGESPDILQSDNYIKASAFLKDKGLFDSEFFSYLPAEAAIMDPQMRIFHEVVWEALEDAACVTEDETRKIGLFAGGTANTNWVIYSELMNGAKLVDGFTASSLNNIRFMPTRISNLLNLRGPSVFVDSACSTSLMAIQQACKSLLFGDCKIAVAGGVSLNYRSNKGYLFSEGMIYSKDGHCRAFDKDATGTIGGEGAAAVVLKPLKDAIKDGDNIWATLRGWGANNDGKNKIGFSAPSVQGECEAILMAHKWAKIDAKSIGYVETHGTGTKLGDPIELEALNLAFGKSDAPYCAIGSVKTNIGHLDAAAGAAGFIKAVLALKHKQIPPSLNFEEANPEINFDKSPFYVNTHLREFKNKEYPLRAGVSSFGIGGTNVHLVLEEAPKKTISKGREHHILLLSAKSEKALNGYVQKLKEQIETTDPNDWGDICYTLSKGRRHFSYRKMMVVSDNDKAISVLEKLGNVPKILPLQGTKQLVFMFSGQGSQYVNMCGDLYEKETFFRNELNSCFKHIETFTGLDMKTILFSKNSESASKINRTEYAQPILFSVEYALAKMLMHWGVVPDVMIGHSIGEYVAACIAEVFSLENAIKLVLQRGALMQKAPEGDMLGISISEERLKVLLSAYPKISIAAINSTESCVVSGTEKDFETFKEELEKEGYKYSILKTSHAFHSHLMDGILDEFENTFQGISLNAPKIPIVSNLQGDIQNNEAFTSVQYWSRHLRNTVRFAQGIETILGKNNTLFIEIGPGKTLSSLVASHSSYHAAHGVVNTLRHPKEQQDDQKYLLNAIGKLWSQGIPIRWEEFYENSTRTKVSMPTYAFDKQEFPVNVDAFHAISSVNSGSGLAALGEKMNAEWLESRKDQQQDVVLPMEGIIDGTEGKLLKIWRQFFGKNTIALEDDFFELGGDSLKMLTLIGRINEALHTSISISDFFERPNAKQLAEWIKTTENKAVINFEEDTFKTLEKDWYVLSSAQKRLYFLYQFDRDSIAYNISTTVKIEGDLDRDRLYAAIHYVVDRHEGLRTGFDLIESEAIQLIQKNSKLEIAYYDDVPSNGVKEVLKNFVQPFQLDKPPLLRVGLLKVNSQEHYLMLDMHHIITDGISQRQMLEEIIRMYSGERLPTLEFQYKDYAEWQQRNKKVRFKKHEQFWLNEFRTIPSLLKLPTDYARPPIKNYRGNTIQFSIGEQQRQQLKQLARLGEATLFTVLLSLFKILLTKLSSESDIVVGTPVSGRVDKRLENIIGVFVNTICIRSQLNEELRYIEWLKDLKRKTIQCLEHQEYQYEDLIDQLKLERSSNHNPLFDVFFSFQNIEDISVAIPELKVSAFQTPVDMALFDLTLNARETKEGITFSFEYATELFKKESIDRFIGYFKNIINAVLTDHRIPVGDIKLMSAAEEQEILYDFNATQLDFPNNQTIVSLFEEKCRTHTKATALTFGEKTWSYEELNERSNQLAHTMVGQGVDNEEIIGISIGRSEEMIIGILAILKVGCAYVPIDPDYPAPRIAHIIENTGLKYIVCDKATEKRLPKSPLKGIEPVYVGGASQKKMPTENLAYGITPEDLAYVIYTSGSTGKPKGVMISHANVMNFYHGITAEIPFDDHESILSLTTMSFDIFVLETIVPLLHGLKVVLASPHEKLDTDKLAQSIKIHQVEMLQITPSHLKSLLTGTSLDTLFATLKVVMVGGEAFPGTLLSRLKEIYKGKVFNMYGPTETTVWSSVQDLTFAETIDIGKPIANTTIRILGPSNQLLPVNSEGELCIGGFGVAKGYWKDEVLTNKKFIPDPYASDELIYKTGDRAKWLPDGSIHYVGRIDNQVKLRGHRIELGEIENAVKSLEKIKDAAVLLREKEEEKFLAAYYTTDEAVDENGLKEQLRLKLPDYMIPLHYKFMEEFPLTPNGKLDRKAFPEINFLEKKEYVAPSNDTEREMTRIWAEVLNIEEDKIGILHNFFDLGGHSLHTVTLHNKINETFQVSIPLKELFDKQDITSISDYIITISNIHNGLEDKELFETTL
ncbi:amino acid adenylation domain-containing protein [Spongiimicrobium salis]|uniref:amino acid adenylation domain-containing protein n=1 Tax=Spongiimicrobium salis TaxID=1667022 RepID=UPI00374CB6E1